MTDGVSFWTVGEQVFIALLFGILAPGAWGIALLSKHEWAKGIVVLVIWAFAFGVLAWFLHRRNRVRLWVSLPGALLVMGACGVVFFRP